MPSPTPRHVPVPLLVGCMLAIAGCGDDDTPTTAVEFPTSAPPLVSVEPASGAELGLHDLIRIELQGPVESLEGIRLRGPSRDVPLRLSGIGDRTVLLDPVETLEPDRAYTLVLEPGLAAGGTTLDRTLELPYRTASPAAGVEIDFDPLGGELFPYPTDLFLGPDPSFPSGRRIDVWTVALPFFLGFGLDDEMDGFDPSSRIHLSPDASLRLPHADASADPTSPILLAVADPSSPRFGELLPFDARMEPIGASQEASPPPPQDPSPRAPRHQHPPRPGGHPAGPERGGAAGEPLADLLRPPRGRDPRRTPPRRLRHDAPRDPRHPRHPHSRRPRGRRRRDPLHHRDRERAHRSAAGARLGRARDRGPRPPDPHRRLGHRRGRPRARGGPVLGVGLPGSRPDPDPRSIRDRARDRPRRRARGHDLAPARRGPGPGRHLRSRHQLRPEG